MINGHAFGEAWGLDVDFKSGNILSIGDDNKILVFNPAQNKVIAESIIN